MPDEVKNLTAAIEEASAVDILELFRKVNDGLGKGGRRIVAV